jgi:hypothetical protein
VERSGSNFGEIGASDLNLNESQCECKCDLPTAVEYGRLVCVNALNQIEDKEFELKDDLIGGGTAVHQKRMDAGFRNNEFAKDCPFSSYRKVKGGPSNMNVRMKRVDQH